MSEINSHKSHNTYKLQPMQYINVMQIMPTQARGWLDDWLLPDSKPLNVYLQEVYILDNMGLPTHNEMQAFIPKLLDSMPYEWKGTTFNNSAEIYHGREKFIANLQKQAKEAESGHTCLPTTPKH